MAVDLCAIASVGFLFNDILDAVIDEANKIQRWSIKTHFDRGVFTAAAVLCFGVVAFSCYWLNGIAVGALAATTVLVIAYSILFKRIFLLGNIIAAGVSLSPGLVIVSDVYFSAGRRDFDLTSTVVFLIVGFLLLLSREIKFDEFDHIGDALGRRCTLPAILSGSVLKALHVALGLVSLSLLLALLTFHGKYSLAVNVLLGTTTTGVTAALLIAGHRSQSRRSFSGLTRVVMFVLPVAIFASF